MQNSKLVKLLIGLKKQELREFGKQIKSLYNDYEVAIALFEYLREYYPEMKSPNLNKTVIVRNLHLPRVKDPQKRIMNESSRLYNWLEEFLILKKLKEKGNYLRQRLITEILKERKLSHLFYLKVKGVLDTYKKKINR